MLFREYGLQKYESEGTLTIEQHFQLESDCDDAEFRLYENQDVKLRIKQITIRKTKGAGTADDMTEGEHKLMQISRQILECYPEVRIYSTTRRENMSINMQIAFSNHFAEVIHSPLSLESLEKNSIIIAWAPLQINQGTSEFYEIKASEFNADGKHLYVYGEELRQSIVEQTALEVEQIDNQNNVLVYWPESMNTIVGKLENDQLRSNGDAGYLVYGPYVDLNAGTYSIQISGEVSAVTQASAGWCAITAGNGTEILAKIDDFSPCISTDGRLSVEMNLELSNTKENCEVCVYTNEGTVMQINKIYIGMSTKKENEEEIK